MQREPRPFPLFNFHLWKQQHISFPKLLYIMIVENRQCKRSVVLVGGSEGRGGTFLYSGSSAPGPNGIYISHEALTLYAWSRLLLLDNICLLTLPVTSNPTIYISFPNPRTSAHTHTSSFIPGKTDRNTNYPN